MRIILILILTIFIVSCQPKDKAYKADLDKEFDSGSNIEMPELTEDLIGSLELLGKTWGFLKYYHPEIAKGNYQWDYELFRLIPAFMEASSNAEREKLLLKWMAGFGKIKKCKNCKKTNPDAFLKPDLRWLNKNVNSKALRDQLNYIYENRNQGEHYYIKMAPGVGNPDFENEYAYFDMSSQDDGLRLLALFRYWNMINYFFPYKHLTEKDWGEVLKEYIPVFLGAQNNLEYELACIQLIGEIQDTHANLVGGKSEIYDWKGRNYPPVHLRFIEDKLVVVDYYNPELKEDTGLEIGDVITKVGEQTIEEIIADISKYYPASNEPTRLRNISADILRSQENELEIEFLRNRKFETKTIKLYPRTDLNVYSRYRRTNGKSYRLLENNIGYITLQTIQNEDIRRIKDEFKDTKGIIIDIRNYPSYFVPFKLGTYFLSSSTPFVKFTKGNLNNPGEFTFTRKLVIPKSKNHYSGKLIVLVNELSQSQAEYTAMAFRANKNTTIIGSTTAGADGNVSAIMLPGGLKTRISGIGVYYPDGKETQRVGIIPDIEVKPTIDGIKSGKDELLEKAIELIQKHKNQQVTKCKFNSGFGGCSKVGFTPNYPFLPDG